MARRKSKRKTRSRRRSSINLMNTAELLVTSNILTQGLFNANLMEFATGRTQQVSMSQGGQFYTAYSPSTSDSVITLPELLGMDAAAGKFGTTSGSIVTRGGYSFAANPAMAMATITANAKANAMNMIIQTVGTKVFFKVAKKVTSKQRSAINKGLNFVGLKEVRA